VPHAINTELYKPKDKQESRKKLNLPKDAFIVGTVAMNKGIPSRKCFGEMLDAFAIFKKKHTDAVYYLHTEALGINNKGFNIPEKCNQLGLKMGKDILLPDKYQKIIGYSESWMSDMYSALDVHMLVSMGEGFGIPTVEAQACGCPVIVSGWTASEELCFSGHKVDKKDAHKQYTGIASYQWIPNPEAIARKLCLEYNNPSPRDRAHRMAQEYSIENVFKNHFEPTMKEIEHNLIEHKERYKKGGSK